MALGRSSSGCSHWANCTSPSCGKLKGLQLVAIDRKASLAAVASNFGTTAMISQGCTNYGAEN